MAVAASPFTMPMPRVLSEAVGRIADLWQLSNTRLGAVIGLSAPNVSRL